MTVGPDLPGWARYLLATGIFGAALGLRFLALPVEAGIPFLFFFPGTALAALFCGLVPTLFYIFLAAATGTYIFLPPHWAFDGSKIVPTLSFVVSATTILLVVHFYQRRVARQTQALTDEIAARQRLADKLQQSFDEINRLNADLERRVAERTAELERSNRELDDFAYIASHDLKEPLRGLHNYASFLQEDHADRLDDEGRHYLERMQRLVERLTALIDGLLAYSRVGASEAVMEPVALDPLLDEVAEDLQPLLRGGLVRATPLPTVRCNALWVREVFQNLIANAVKYNDKPLKRVEVGCDTSGQAPAFYVRDNGIGIAPQHQDSVFRIFKRLHEQDKYGGGTGAGLTIVKKIVERHGGRIWLESTPGEGTTFHFTLSGNT